MGKKAVHQRRIGEKRTLSPKEKGGKKEKKVQLENAAQVDRLRGRADLFFRKKEGERSSRLKTAARSNKRPKSISTLPLTSGGERRG